MTFRGNTVGSADVAFVVEVANCNKNREMISLLDALDVQFKKDDIGMFESRNYILLMFYSR